MRRIPPNTPLLTSPGLCAMALCLSVCLSVTSLSMRYKFRSVCYGSLSVCLSVTSLSTTYKFRSVSYGSLSVCLSQV